MLKSYEAIYEHGELRWLDGEPDIADGDRVTVVLDARVERGSCGEDLDRAWEEARGAWGKAKTLDEIDREISAQRDWDWKRDWGSPNVRSSCPMRSSRPRPCIWPFL